MRHHRPCTARCGSASGCRCCAGRSAARRAGGNPASEGRRAGDGCDRPHRLVAGAGPGSKPTAHHTLLAFGAAPTTGFFRNIVTLGSVHLADQGVVQFGTSAEPPTFPGNYRQNIVTIGQIAPSGGDAVGYRDFGQQNIVTIADIDTEQGPARFGVVLEPSATGDQVTANINRSGTRLAGGDFQDRGRDNTVTINGKSFRNGNLMVLTNLPTACAGQARGTVWNNKGALALCP
jgi:hypothetical protein